MKNSWAGSAVSALFLGVGIVARSFVPNIFCIWTACQYVPFFYLGMRIRLKEESGKNTILSTVPWLVWITMDILVFIATMIIEKQEGTLWRLASVGSDFLLHVVGAMMAWTCLQILAGRVNWKNNKAFIKMSSYSMPIYLFHQQVIYFTIALLNGRVNPWINACVNFHVAIIVSFVISSVLMRWKTTRFLIGEY